MKEFNGTQMTGSTGSTGSWVSVKEYALMKGVSRQAVMKAIEKGKLQSRQIPGRNQHGVSYEVWVDNLQPEAATKCCNLQPATDNLQPEAATKSCNLPLTTTALKDLDSSLRWNDGNVEIGDQAMDSMDGMDGDSAALPGLGGEGDGDLGFRSAPPQAMECRPSGTEKRQDDASTKEAMKSKRGSVIEYVPYHKLDEAQLYALLLQEIDRRVRGAASKTAEWAAITSEYNQGELVPELKKLKGHRSERGLRHWYQKWQESEQDMFELVHKNNAQVRGRKVTWIEQNFLIKNLLVGWEKPIMNAIRELKVKAHQGVLESPSSVATLKRWCSDFAEDNPAEWCQGRRGDKAVMEDIVKSVDRDDSSIEPLQVVVVDGHKLNVYVKHPITGKPFRPTLITVFDWGTRYPVGMALALTEDSSHTLTAFRNAFLHMGMIPKWALLDNGKAFRSKLFNEKWEEHDLEKEFAGIFPRLGIDAHFARAYNGKSKVVERWFRTLDDQWSSRQASYCGRDIKAKPAHFGRNEKWMQEMFGAKAMDYAECMHSIYEYIRWEYGMAVHSTTKQRPYEAFTNAVRDPERLVDPVKLNIMMLTAERKQLRSEGIWLYKNKYWAPEMVNHVGKKVIIRYDYNDLRNILVYDERSRPICMAELRESQSAWIFAEMDNPLVAQRLWAEDREIEGIKRTIRKKTKQLVNISKKVVDEAVAKHQHLIDQRKAEVREHNPAFVNKPMMPAPVKRKDVNQEVAELEKLAAAAVETGREVERSRGREAESGQSPEDLAGETPAFQSKVIVLEDLLKEEEGELAESVSFSEMQKIIGISR